MTEERAEYNAGKVRPSKYLELQLRESFYKLHYRSFPVVRELGGPVFSTYLYMIENITRGKSRYKWWNETVLPYYQKGYLPFAKHQKYMAQDLDKTQQAISLHLIKLTERGLIKLIDTVQYNLKKDMTIYSLGIWSTDSRGIYQEVFYLAELTF